MSGSLFNLIQTQQSNKSNKTKLGYSVSTYKNVLDALEQSKYKNIKPPSGKVMGKDVSYADVDEMSFDSNGFSTNTDYAIWKMSMSRWGAMPVKNTLTNKIIIAKYEKDGERGDRARGKNECPTEFVDDQFANVAENFEVGAKVDLTGLALSYFNTMFCSRGASHKMEADALSQLVALQLLNVEVIFPNAGEKGDSALVGILGQTPIRDNAILYINNCILGCNEWKSFGVDVRGTNSSGSQSLISGGKYQFALEDATYDYKTNSIKDFGREKYNYWAKYKDLTELPVTIVLNVIDTVYVRFFITPTPQNVAAALKWLPLNYSRNIYKTFGDVIRETSLKRPSEGGSVQVMLARSLEYWKNMVYNNGDPNGITYTVGGGHGLWRYQGEDGDVKYSLNGLYSSVFSPLFVPKVNPHVLDCSSFSSMMLFNSGIFDPTKIPTVLDSTTFLNAEQTWGDKILSSYKITNTNFDGTGKLLPGDVLYSTNILLGKEYGHAAVVYKDDEQTGDLCTLEINTTNGKNLPILKKNHHKRDYYKHLFRFVDNE